MESGACDTNRMQLYPAQCPLVAGLDNSSCWKSHAETLQEKCGSQLLQESIQQGQHDDTLTGHAAHRHPRKTVPSSKRSMLRAHWKVR